MDLQEVKIPETLDTFIRNQLGYGLKELLSTKKEQVIKRDLVAQMNVCPERHYEVYVPVIIKQESTIVIAGPDHYGFNDLGYTNDVAFQFQGLEFSYVNSGLNVKSRFSVPIEALIKAIKK